MMQRTQTRGVSSRYSALIVALITTVSLILSGCSSQPTHTSAPDSGKAAAPANPNAGIDSPAASLGGDGSFARIWKNGLRICTTSDAPYNFKDSSGKLVGIDAEIIAEAVNRLKIPRTSFVEGPWESMVPNLQSDRCDLLQTNIHYTDKRAEVIAFTGPGYFYADYLVVQKGNPKNLHKWEDLKGHSAGALRGENYVDWLQKYSGHGEIKTYKTFEEEIADLATGRVDALIGDEVVFAYYLVQHPEAQVELAEGYLPQTSLDDWTRFGVQKGANDLANAFSRVLDQMRIDGTTYKILKKYGIGKHAVQEFKNT